MPRATQLAHGGKTEKTLELMNFEGIVAEM